MHKVSVTTFIIVLSVLIFILLTTLNDEFNYYKCPENYQLMFVGHRYEIFTHKCIDLSNNDVVNVSITNDEEYENAKYLNKVGVYFGRIFFGAVLLMSLIISCAEVFIVTRRIYDQFGNIDQV